MKQYALIATVLLVLAMLAGCAGSTAPGTGTVIVVTPPEVPASNITLPLSPAAGPAFPTTTVRDIPAPAPCPWPGVAVYTEQTYEIDVKAGDQFAIGMFASLDYGFNESHDGRFLAEVAPDRMVKYQPTELNRYGTDWFLFKATKPGATDIIFRYPLEYTKDFKIVIQ